MSRVPARRSTRKRETRVSRLLPLLENQQGRKRTKIVHRYLVGPVDSPQFYVEDYVSAHLFLVYIPDDYSAKLPGLERFTLGRRLFEEIPAYRTLQVDRRTAVLAEPTIAPRSANVLHVPLLDIEIRGGRVIRLGG